MSKKRLLVATVNKTDIEFRYSATDEEDGVFLRLLKLTPWPGAVSMSFVDPDDAYYARPLAETKPLRVEVVWKDIKIIDFHCTSPVGEGRNLARIMNLTVWPDGMAVNVDDSEPLEVAQVS